MCWHLLSDTCCIWNKHTSVFIGLRSCRSIPWKEWGDGMSHTDYFTKLLSNHPVTDEAKTELDKVFIEQSNRAPSEKETSKLFANFLLQARHLCHCRLSSRYPSNKCQAYLAGLIWFCHEVCKARQIWVEGTDQWPCSATARLIQVTAGGCPFGRHGGSVSGTAVLYYKLWWQLWFAWPGVE